MAVREEIELDISAALSAIDRVGDSLDSVAATFQTSVEEALSSLSGTSNVDITATVEAETDEARAATEEAITEGVASANTTVTPEADIVPMAEQLSAFEASIPPIVIEVDADTADAQTELEELGRSSRESSEGVDTLTTAAAGMSAAAGIASGSAAELGASVGGVSPVAGAVAGSLGVLSAATAEFFSNALDAESANLRFSQTFGPLADTVNSLNVGSLNADLSELALQLGSDDDALRQVLSSFAQIGTSSGATQQEIAKTSEELATLAARAVALNPSLGSVDQVAQRMQTALARGGRFAAQFGVDLTAAEINARALAESGKQTAAELSVYEKAAAGAAIATEKYGSTLDEVINQGTQNPVVQLRALKQSVSEAAEAVGAPLVAPIFDLLESAQPIAVSFAEILGSLASAVIPSVTAVLTTLGPPIQEVSNVFGEVSGEIGPALASVFQALAGAAEPTLQIFTAILPIVVPFATGLATLAEGVTTLFEALGPIPGILGVVAAAWVAFTVLLNVNPVFLVITALVTLVGVIKQYSSETEAAPVNMQKYSDALFGQAETAADLSEKLKELDKNSKSYLATQSEFAKLGATTDLLKVTDLETVNQQIQQGAEGLEAFTASAINVGRVKIEIDGVDQSAEDIANLNGQLASYLASGKAEVTRGEELVQAMNLEVAARENASHAKLDELVATGQLTLAQREELIARANSEGQINSYSAALQNAIVLAQQNAAAAEAQNPPLSNNAANWVALTQAVAIGSFTIGDAKDQAEKFGVSADQMTQFVKDATKAIDDMVNQAVSKLPSVNGVFDALNLKSDPATLTSNLNAATFQILVFGTNLETIKSQGFDKVAEFLQTQGPQAAGTFAQAFVNATDEQKNALQRAIDVNEQARKAYGDDLRNDIANSAGAAKQFAEQATSGFNEGLDFQKVTSDEVGKAKEVLTGAGIDDFKKDANAGGSSVGAELAAGIEAGLVKGFPGLEQQAREAIRRMEAAAKDEAGIKSPSRLFAEVGDQLGAGMALGLEDSTPQIVAAAEQIVRDAARAAVSSPVPVPVSAFAGPTAAATDNQTGASGNAPFIGVLQVDVVAAPGVTPAQARATGEAVAEGITDKLALVKAKVITS